MSETGNVHTTHHICSPGDVGPERADGGAAEDAEREGEEDVKGEPHEKTEEEPVVPATHTVVNPRTVVVEILQRGEVSVRYCIAVVDIIMHQFVYCSCKEDIIRFVWSRTTASKV